MNNFINIYMFIGLVTGISSWIENYKKIYAICVDTTLLPTKSLFVFLTTFGLIIYVFFWPIIAVRWAIVLYRRRKLKKIIDREMGKVFEAMEDIQSLLGKLSEEDQKALSEQMIALDKAIKEGKERLK